MTFYIGKPSSKVSLQVDVNNLGIRHYINE